MLKSEVKNLNRKEELPFPKLMIYKAENIIIIAIFKAGGTIEGVVVSGTRHKIGEIKTTWSAELFTDFYGSITLTQTPE